MYIYLQLFIVVLFIIVIIETNIDINVQVHCGYKRTVIYPLEVQVTIYFAKMWCVFILFCSIFYFCFSIEYSWLPRLFLGTYYYLTAI